MDRNEKNELISSLKGTFEETTTVVVAHYAGLSVTDMSNLRTNLREVGGSMRVVKNRLAKIAVAETSKECLLPVLTGPTVMAFSSDPVAAAKVFSEFAKTNKKLIVLGGALNDNFLDASAVDSLAKLPSLDELRGKLVGLVQAPATKIAGVVAAPAGQLARVIKAYATKDAA